MSDATLRELRRLSRLFKVASASFERLASELEVRGGIEPPSVAASMAAPVTAPPSAGEPVAAGAKAPASRTAVEDTRSEPPWEALVEGALAVLGANPARVWKPAELARAVRDAGVQVDSLQGVHFGLLPRLRDRGAILEVPGGVTACIAGADETGSKAPAPSRLVVSEPPPALAVAPPPRKEQPWAEIIAAAMKLLREDPDRRWGQAELGRAVRGAGVRIDSLQGLHLGLTHRLKSLGLAELDTAGTLRLSPLVGGHAESPPSAAPPRPSGAASDEGPEDPIDALAEEIDACEMFLDRMSDAQRTAQLAVWAGRARDLQELGADDPEMSRERRSALRRVFGRLTRIAREQRCGWVDALTPEWVVNWTIYVEYYEAALSNEDPALTELELQSFWRGKLRGLLLPTRKHVSHLDALEVISHATTALPPDDEELRAAVDHFGPARRAKPPTVRKVAAEPAPAPLPAAPSEPSAPHVSIPDDLVAATRGKRALIVGGQGAREEHRKAVQAALDLAELDWVFSERGAASHYSRLEERVKHGTYDLVLFLAGYTSHKAVPFLRQCKASGVPLVYLARGYSLAQVVRALEEQWMARSASRPEGSRGASGQS